MAKGTLGATFDVEAAIAMISQRLRVAHQERREINWHMSTPVRTVDNPTQHEWREIEHTGEFYLSISVGNVRAE